MDHETEIRTQALDYALRESISGGQARDILARAEEFRKFLRAQD